MQTDFDAHDRKTLVEAIAKAFESGADDSVGFSVGEDDYYCEKTEDGFSGGIDDMSLEPKSGSTVEQFVDALDLPDSFSAVVSVPVVV